MRNDPPKISVVIPVYNGADYLRQCLDSLAAQTLPETEFICVDDGSTDGTAAILAEYAAVLPALRVLRFDGNRGAFAARQAGIAASRGAYVLLSDADDYWEEDACTQLYARICASGADVLQFGGWWENCTAAPDKALCWLDAVMSPPPLALTGEELLRAVFLEARLNPSLWNKIYRGELLRSVSAALPETRISAGQDAYLYFHICRAATRFVTWPQGRFYHYCYGRGLWSQGEPLSPERFRRLCGQAAVTDRLREELEAEGVLPEYADVLAAMRARMLRLCCARWHAEVPDDDAVEAADLLVKHWGAAEAAAGLSEVSRGREGDTADRLRGSALLAQRPTAVCRVGVYYAKGVGLGGVERVLSLLIPCWQNAGYEVVLLSDRDPGESEYALPPGLLRRTLPTGPDAARRKALRDVIRGDALDAVVWNSWYYGGLLRDLLTVKAAGAAFILYFHSPFTIQLLRGQRAFAQTPRVIALADAVVNLTTVNHRFFTALGARSLLLQNPSDTRLLDLSTDASEKRRIVWAGRLCRDKGVDEAMRAMCLVRDKLPDATLWIVGEADTQKERTAYETRRDELGLAGCVEFRGGWTDMTPFYVGAALHLMTSLHECAPMVLSESRAAGLPAVMFALPDVEMCRDGRGIVAVPPGNVSALATAICALLTDEERRRALGQEAREAAYEAAAYDLGAAWGEVFCLVCTPPPLPSRDDTQRMLASLLFAYDASPLWNRTPPPPPPPRKSLPARAVQCVRRHGLFYTLRLGIKRLFSRAAR